MYDLDVRHDDEEVLLILRPQTAVRQCARMLNHIHTLHGSRDIRGAILRPQDIGSAPSAGPWSDGEPETDLSLESSRARRSGMLIPELEMKHLLTSKTELVGRRPCRPGVSIPNAHRYARLTCSRLVGRRMLCHVGAGVIFGDQPRA